VSEQRPFRAPRKILLLPRPALDLNLTVSLIVRLTTELFFFVASLCVAKVDLRQVLKNLIKGIENSVDGSFGQCEPKTINV